ncbi:DUF6095 family protein [Confluentibacter lentus]|uniref:DUF6095 family protein n=1 Tax=Confluentibacter lentus TaxID=1699412 RepID=UPI000C2919CD|nr:DUF6095 family protein [Confluentibacter lentus]
METSKTDKKILAKGVKTLIFAVLSLFMGPILLSVALSNKEKPLYLPILILGCLISAFAIFLIFKGIKIIMNSMFKK